MIETIKSYLVSLGFAVDQGSYNQATKAIDNADKSVAKFAGSAVRQFATAATAVVSFVAAANVGLAKFIGDLAQADLANEKLARQLWTSKEQAASFNNSLKAMGVELQDLYLSPELMRNFQTLRQQAGSMRAPQEFGEMMKFIRSIQFEFTRMKLEATYAMQWIGYYLIKYMGGPLKDIKTSLKDMNDTVVKRMPSWTEKIAQVLSWFARLGITVYRTIKDIAHVFAEIGQSIPDNIKLIGAAVAGLAAVVVSGPLGMLITGFTTLLLLLDDFYTYLDGGESAFGAFWKKIMDFYDSLKGSGAIAEFKKDIKDAFQEILKELGEARTWFSDFYKDLEQNGTLDNLKKTFENTFDIVNKILAGAKIWVQDLWKEIGKQGVLTDLKNNFEKVILSVSNLLEEVTRVVDTILGMSETESTLQGIGGVLNDVIIVALKTVNQLMEGIAGYVDVIAKTIGGGLLESTEQAGKESAERLQQKPKQTVISGMYQDAVDLLTQWDSPTFRDKVRRAAGLIAKSVSQEEAASYIYPSSNTQNTNSNSISLNQVNNIHGSDPNATAGAVVDNTKSLLMRSMRGVIR